jgi:hypothetical protein
MPVNDTPATVFDKTDPGDEVQRRYRYQINYSALKALHLLANKSSITAIYCEQIEDLLVEFRDGRFWGYQIKTRELDQAPIKAGDEIIVSALARFCVKDVQFRGRLSLFFLVTNFVFFKGESGDDIRNVLQCARNNPTLSGLSGRNSLKRNIESIVKRSNLTIEQVISTLAKVELEERKTGIDQPDLELVQALGQINPYYTYPHSALLAASRYLRTRIWEASSLDVSGAVIEQHQPSANFDQHIEGLRIARKRLDAGDLETLFSSIQRSEIEGELLTIANFLKRQEIPPGLGRMQFKMALGAISFADIEQTKDDVATLESAFIHWKERYGLDEANRRLAHFQYLAIREIRVAANLTQRADETYGAAMLKCVRERLAKTQKQEAASLFGCRAEHLVGAAGLLTEECKAWWSTTQFTDRGDGNFA